jgi:NADH-quinone oxidoreductase subunit M
MIIGVAGILYGALLAMSQTDIKRLIAYTSVSHMGFIVLGVYAFNEMAYQGVVMQMIAHGISTAALFIIAGKLYDRTGTYNINGMGGLWEKIPAAGAMGMIFSLALLGLPGLGNFIAEFLTLAGAFRSSVLFSSLASLGLVIATIYSLRLVQKVFFGKRTAEKEMKDLSLKESVVLGVLVIAIIFTGLFPQVIIKRAAPALNKSIQAIEPGMNAGRPVVSIPIKDLNPPAGASSGQSL